MCLHRRKGIEFLVRWIKFRNLNQSIDILLGTEFSKEHLNFGLDLKIQTTAPKNLYFFLLCVVLILFLPSILYTLSASDLLQLTSCRTLFFEHCCYNTTKSGTRFCLYTSFTIWLLLFPSSQSFPFSLLHSQYVFVILSRPFPFRMIIIIFVCVM